MANLAAVPFWFDGQPDHAVSPYGDVIDSWSAGPSVNDPWLPSSDHTCVGHGTTVSETQAGSIESPCHRPSDIAACPQRANRPSLDPNGLSVGLESKLRYSQHHSMEIFAPWLASRL